MIKQVHIQALYNVINNSNDDNNSGLTILAMAQSFDPTAITKREYAAHGWFGVVLCGKNAADQPIAAIKMAVADLPENVVYTAATSATTISDVQKLARSFTEHLARNLRNDLTKEANLLKQIKEMTDTERVNIVGYLGDLKRPTDGVVVELYLEWIEGQRIMTKIAECNPSDIEKQRYLGTILRTIRFLHSATFIINGASKTGVAHLDLHERNVMITSDNKVKIVDFGLAIPGPNTEQRQKDMQLFGSLVGLMWPGETSSTGGPSEMREVMLACTAIPEASSLTKYFPGSGTLLHCELDASTEAKDSFPSHDDRSPEDSLLLLPTL